MYGLTVRHLNVAYGDSLILQDISVAVPKGSLVAVVGPNGAGKTTFLKAIVQLIPRLSGHILIEGVPFESKRARVAYIAQRSAIDWDFPLSVIEVVLMGSYGKLGFFRRAGRVEYQQAYERLHEVGMADMAHVHIGQLSGGQQQRLLVARALMQEADLYLLDEPLAGVDSYAESLVLELLKKLSVGDKTVLVVHHHVAHVSHYFDTILLLNRSQVSFGPTQEILHSPLFATFYTPREIQ